MQYYLFFIILTLTSILPLHNHGRELCVDPLCQDIASKGNGKSDHRFCLATKPSQCKSRVSRYGTSLEIDESVAHNRIFVGPLIDSDNDGKLRLRENATIFVTKSGKIESIGSGKVPKYDKDEYEIRYLKHGQFIIPGFIDGHVHAVQFPNLGIGYDEKLNEWLEKYTVPLEMRFKDEDYASNVFDLVVQRNLKLGTTTSSYFSALYGNTTAILADKVKLYGQRAFVGKNNRNSPERHGYYQTTESALNDIEAVIRYIQNLESPLVQYISTPSDAVSSDMELMKAIGQLAKKHNFNIQTHCAETMKRVKTLKSLYKNLTNYAEVYDAAGLLTNKTILAHGVYLTDKELKIIKERGSAVIHCPASNTILKSGLCDVRRLMKAGVKVGLGTDVSGGNYASILDMIRSAMEVSIHLSFIKKAEENYIPLDHKEAFYLATLGGARALAIDDKVGNFEPGKEFDALLIDLDSRDSLLDDFQDYTLDEMLQRFLYSGDDRNIIEVYVSGKCVVKRME